MKNILMIGLALCLGVSLSSCDDDDEVRPMAITPTGSMDFGDETDLNDPDQVDDFGDSDSFTETDELE